MKKWLILALSVSFLAGCESEEEAEGPLEDSLEQEETNELEEAEENEDEIEEESADETAEEGADSIEESADPLADDYPLLMPDAEQDLVDNPTVLANLHMVAEQYGPLVQEIDQDWLEIWSGVVTVDPETQAMDAYFLLVNGTGQNASNLTFTVGVVNEATGEPLFEDILVSLTEEDYGIWEDKTVMPFSISIPEELEEDVVQFMEQGAQGIPVVENLEYDVE